MEVKLYIYYVTDVAKEAKKRNDWALNWNREMVVGEGKERGREGGGEEQGGRGILKDIQDMNTLSLTLKDVEMWWEIYFSSKIQENSMWCYSCAAKIIVFLYRERWLPHAKTKNITYESTGLNRKWSTFVHSAYFCLYKWVSARSNLGQLLSN